LDLTLAEMVAALTATSCRWPHGDPQHPDFRFCGSPVTASPYCEEHRAVAYLTPPPLWVRRRRRSTRGIAYTSARGIAWAG
jgi:GcrA cell cycle regulator